MNGTYLRPLEIQRALESVLPMRFWENIAQSAKPYIPYPKILDNCAVNYPVIPDSWGKFGKSEFALHRGNLPAS